MAASSIRSAALLMAETAASDNNRVTGPVIPSDAFSSRWTKLRSPRSETFRSGYSLPKAQTKSRNSSLSLHLGNANGSKRRRI